MHELKPNEIHLWTLDPAKLRSDDPAILSFEEKTRASRLQKGEQTKAFIRSRIHLRLLLGDYLECDPAEVQITYGKMGKPSLKFPKADIEFNLSHSGPYTLFALSKNVPLGVDLEEVRHNVSSEKIAERFFSKQNRRILENIHHPEEKLYFFFKCWTFHEAYLKAQGQSAFSTEQVKEEIFFGEEEQSLLYLKSGWTIQQVPSPEGFLAAVAAQQKTPQLKHFTFE